MMHPDQEVTDTVDHERWGATFTAEQVNSLDFGLVSTEYAKTRAQRDAEKVERLIIEGNNDFTVGNIRYTLPRWHRQPINRLRVEWARWKARRG